jgi:Tfp pilus assembly protein PilO
MNASASNRLWVIGSRVLVVAIIAMGWFLGVSPKLAEAATAGDQLVAAEAENVVQQHEVEVIKKQFEKLPELKSQLAALRAAVPAGDAMSAFLDELHALELASNVTLTDFKANDGQPYTPVKDALTTVSTTNPLITAENFVAIPVSLTVSGSTANVMSFINGVQTGQRLYLVQDLKLKQSTTSDSKTTSESTGDFEAAIDGFVYVLLDNPPAPAKTAKTADAPKG